MLGTGPRVDRLPGFLSSRPSWLSPLPARKWVLPHPPFGSGGHSLAGVGGGGASSDKGKDTPGTLGIVSLYINGLGPRRLRFFAN